jgi:serine protease Do
MMRIGRRIGDSLSLVLAGVLAAAAAPARSTVDPALALSLARGIVRVEVSQEAGRRFVGTGTVVATERVVTACHVTMKAERIHVLQGGVRRLVSAQLPDMEHDLCLLAVPGLTAGAVPLGRAGRLVVGETVLAMGFSGGVVLSPAFGAVENLHRLDGATVVQCDARFTSGASGGGLFNEAGALVGILMFRLRGPGPQYFAVPVEWFEARIDRSEAYGPVAPVAGVPFWARPAEALPRFMQAHTLEAEGRWDDLERFALVWSRADADDAEAAYWRGVAEDHLAHDTAAIDAYREAVSLDARHAASWYRLGRVYLRGGRAAEARAVLPGLLRASEPLARRLIRELPELPD